MTAVRENPVRQRLRSAKQAAVESAVGRAEGWVRRVLDGDQGVMLDDIPPMLEALGLRICELGDVVVDPELLAAYQIIVARATAQPGLLTGRP